MERRPTWKYKKPYEHSQPLSLPDITAYGTWIALAGVVVAAVVGGVPIYFKYFKKKKPKVELECTAKSWNLRRESSIVTDVYVTLLLKNTEAPTTINKASIVITYKGTTYPPVEGSSQPYNIMLEPGASTPKQFVFNVPKQMVIIDDTIERATVTVTHTHDSKSIEITDIKRQQ
jgi:hypothetical protein